MTGDQIDDLATLMTGDQIDDMATLMTGHQQCTKAHTKVTLDHNWRWLHAAGDYINCYKGNEWYSEFCPDPAMCTENFELKGVDANDWTNTYRITSDGTGLRIKFVTAEEYTTGVSSWTFYMFCIGNGEFTFDGEVSELPAASTEPSTW